MRAAILLACFLSSQSAWAAPPTLGQHTTIVASSGGTITLSPASLTVGSTIIAVACHSGNDGDQDYTFSGSTNGSYTLSQFSGYTTGVQLDRACRAAYKINQQATSETLTITLVNGTSTARGYWLEVLPAMGMAIAFDTSCTTTTPESADGTGHTTCGSLTTSSDVFVLAFHGGNGTMAYVEPSGFTDLDADMGTGVVRASYYSHATGITSSTLAWTSGTARTVANIAVAFRSVPIATRRGGNLLMGVGR